MNLNLLSGIQNPKDILDVGTKVVFPTNKTFKTKPDITMDEIKYLPIEIISIYNSHRLNLRLIKNKRRTSPKHENQQSSSCSKIQKEDSNDTKQLKNIKLLNEPLMRKEAPLSKHHQ
jgi:hypothetical protein